MAPLRPGLLELCAEYRKEARHPSNRGAPRRSTTSRPRTESSPWSTRRPGLIDELRLHIVPLTLGAGTRLFEGVPPLKLEQVMSRAASSVTHVTYRVLS